MSNALWERDDVQFARLLAEIKAVGLTADQVKCIGVSMDLTTEQVCEIFDRAEEAFEALVEKHSL
jgi:ribosomal protein L13E